jgi:hypothetical protein
MPRYLRTRQNPNWTALIEALGEQDDQLAELIQEVRKQFFVKTASRPYLDTLGSNVGVSRPRQIGMDDPTFRKYIPVLAYQPKQVKLILDQLLDVFFFKESTSAFTQSQAFDVFALEDGWKLEYLVDGINDESIEFVSSEFLDIANATPSEVAAAINRKAEYSFAVVFDDRVNDRQHIRIFTNTIGSKGSIQVTGGRANIGLQFLGYKQAAGNGADTTWLLTKVGETMTLQYTGGASPNLNAVQPGDVVILDTNANTGSFIIETVDLTTQSVTYADPFGVASTVDHTVETDSYIKFMSPDKYVIYTNRNRAVAWETSPGQIVVEIPATPPVVKRFLKGSAHINGTMTTVANRVDNTTLELQDAADWPITGGKFALQEQREIQLRYLTSSEDTLATHQMDTRFNKDNIYTYTGKSGNTISGISPDLPAIASVDETAISTVSRDNAGTLTVNTTVAHNLEVGQPVALQNVISALTTTTGIEIDVSASDTADAVATRMANELNSHPDFTAFSVGSTVTVTTAVAGITTDAADVDAGVTINVVQQGTAVLPETTEITVAAGSTYDVTGDASRFNLNAAGDTTQYHVWFRVVDGSGDQINPGMDELPNGPYTVLSTPTTTQFTVNGPGQSGNGIDGLSRVETTGITASGSLVYLTSARLDTGVFGPNVWNPNAAFVLSSLTTTIQEDIKAGQIVRTLTIDTPNNIPDEEGFVIFGFGTDSEEGPVRYFFKPNDSTIQLDPSYIFQNNHDTGSALTVIRRKGAHVLSTTGAEYAPYLTDPSVAREVLQELMLKVKSVGVFMEFLVRYPEQLYATLDVYRSGDVSLWPIDEDDLADRDS